MFYFVASLFCGKYCKWKLGLKVDLIIFGIKGFVAADYGVVRLKDEDWKCHFSRPLLGFVSGDLIVGGFCLCVCVSLW